MAATPKSSKSNHDFVLKPYAFRDPIPKSWAQRPSPGPLTVHRERPDRPPAIQVPNRTCPEALAQSAECGRDPVAMSVVPNRRSPKIGIYRFHVPRLLGFYAKIKQLQIRTQPACCLTHVILKRPTVKFTGCQGGRASSPIRRFSPNKKTHMI